MTTRRKYVQQPPALVEPTEVGSRVRSSDGTVWVRLFHGWIPAEVTEGRVLRLLAWPKIDAVEVLSGGCDE